jgi:hypothetical protein
MSGWLWWIGALSLFTGAVMFRRRRLRRKVGRKIRTRAGQAVQGRVRSAKARQRSSSWKPAPLLTPTPTARKPVLRIQRCSAACRTSRKPASTCDCECGGRDHGRYRPDSAAAIRATKYTATQQKAQRQAQAAARTKRWEDRQQTLQSKVKVERGGRR